MLEALCSAAERSRGRQQLQLLLNAGAARGDSALMSACSFGCGTSWLTKLSLALLLVKSSKVVPWACSNIVLAVVPLLQRYLDVLGNDFCHFRELSTLQGRYSNRPAVECTLSCAGRQSMSTASTIC